MPLLNSVRSALCGVAVLGVALTFAPALQAQKISTSYDHHAEFAQYKTFSFFKVQTPDPAFDKQVTDKITQDLQARGWQMVPSGGDVTVTAIAAIKSNKEYTAFYNDLGAATWNWHGFGRYGKDQPSQDSGTVLGYGESVTGPSDIPVGTLVVDLYDSKTHNLVFRGTSTSDLHKHEGKNIILIDKRIDQIFEKFPPPTK